MQYRELGRTGLNVSSVCLGTMTWGDQNTEAEGHAQMDLAVERGVNFFDTAELYSIPPKPDTFGSTERIIGAWFAKTGRRRDIVLATKIVGRSPMAWFRDGSDGLDGGMTRHTRKQIDAAVEQSLKRLQTDYIDLYQLHWPDRGYSGFGYLVYRDYPEDFLAFEDILEALSRHVEAGRIRHLGVSNESPWGVMRFLAAADARGWPRLVSIQNAYSLVNRSFETGGLAEIALREKVGLLAYSPLAQGYLTGKYRGGALPAGSRKALFDRLQRYERLGADTAFNAYLDLAAEIGASPAHLALKFVDTRPWTTSTIIGATTLGQLDENLAAFDFAWTKEVEDRVNALHNEYRNPCP